MAKVQNFQSSDILSFASDLLAIRNAASGGFTIPSWDATSPELGLKHSEYF